MSYCLRSLLCVQSPVKFRFYGQLCPSLLPSLPLVFTHVSLCSLILLEEFVVRAVPRKISVFTACLTLASPFLASWSCACEFMSYTAWGVLLYVLCLVNFGFTACLNLPSLFLDLRSLCTWVYATLNRLSSFVVRAVPRKFRFTVYLILSLPFLAPRMGVHEFLQFILPEEFVVPRNFWFYGVLEPSLPCFWFVCGVCCTSYVP